MYRKGVCSNRGTSSYVREELIGESKRRLPASSLLEHALSLLPASSILTKHAFIGVDELLSVSA